MAALCGHVIYYNCSKYLKICLLCKKKLLSHQVLVIVLVHYWWFHSQHNNIFSNPRLQEQKGVDESTKITDEKAALKSYLRKAVKTGKPGCGTTKLVYI